ncbi:MAG: Protein YidD [uncultured Sulfurovum sp.]|uniref:Protein YidD n=1 Tax=uncultured Sulfurovum sp. TaxID=269237 RepID=A0A6S6U137_9BACT|nr:MAG: Protein YidD [uncultured Sulfurovum sp.]
MEPISVFTKFFILPIKGYQYISKMLPANCRYYPTCSEYAKWQFEFNRVDKAFLQSSARILRCNQLFAGGIDYPILKFTPPDMLTLNQTITIKYWIVPKEKELFYIIKNFYK